MFAAGIDRRGVEAAVLRANNPVLHKLQLRLVGTVVTMGDDALVSDGLRVGDEMILDAPADLRAGAPIVVERQGLRGD